MPPSVRGSSTTYDTSLGSAGNADIICSYHDTRSTRSASPAVRGFPRGGCGSGLSESRRKSVMRDRSIGMVQAWLRQAAEIVAARRLSTLIAVASLDRTASGSTASAAVRDSTGACRGAWMEAPPTLPLAQHHQPNLWPAAKSFRAARNADSVSSTVCSIGYAARKSPAVARKPLRRLRWTRSPLHHGTTGLSGSRLHGQMSPERRPECIG